jgi:mono/diheme cytochrome c family protein
LSVLAAGCSLNLPGKPNPADRPVASDKVLDFDTLYGQNCAGCHGADGRLGPAPPLNDPIFLAIVPDEELLHVVTEGRPGTPMPAFAQAKAGPLTQAQVEALAAGIKPHWGRGKAPAGVPPYAAGKGRGDTARGREVFAQACATCHGSDGKGTKDVGAIHNWAFLALISDQALRRIAITGRPRPDLGMPDFAGPRPSVPDFKPLTSQQVGDLVALLASWRAEGQSHGR